jgi:molybdopterin-binding protein
MPDYRIGQVAQLLGVSVDTARRWADADLVKTRRTKGGHRVVDGSDLARFAASLPKADEPESTVARSARNRFRGIVTKVTKDKVLASVEIQSGSHRLVSLMTRESADALALAPGVMATASVKSTYVVVEVSGDPSVSPGVEALE